MSPTTATATADFEASLARMQNAFFALTAAEAISTQKDAALAEADSTITAKDRALVQTEAKLDRATLELCGLDEQLERKDQTIEHLEKQVFALLDSAVQKDRQIALLRDKLLRGWDGQLREKQLRFATLEDVRRIFGDLQYRLDWSRDRIEVLEEEVAELKARLGLTEEGEAM